MLIIVSRDDFNGPALFLNGRPLVIVPDRVIDVSAEYIEILRNALIPFTLAPQGSFTGLFIIPKRFGPRVPLSINGNLQYLATGVPLVLSTDMRDILMQAGIVLVPEQLVVGGALPNLGPNTASFFNNAVAGTTITGITGVPAGAVPTFTPADGRIIISGSEATGWRLVTGLSASTPGTINGTISAPGATSANIAITVTSASSLITNRFGQGFNIGSNAQVAPMFNNMAKQGRWVTTGTAPVFQPEFINALGDVIAMPPGAVSMLIPRPGPLSTYRVLIEWDGPATLGAVSGVVSLVSSVANRAVVNVSYPAVSELGQITSIPWAFTAAANPITNLRIHIVDGSDNQINAGTFDPKYLEGVSKAGVVRLLYAHGDPKTNCVDWCGPIDWADRTSPLGRSIPTISYSMAKHTYGAGASQLLFNAMKGTGTGSAYYFCSLVFNSAADIAKSLSELGMRNAVGAGGNNVSVTVNAPSGAGSVTRTLVGNQIDFVVTPPAGCTTATNLANYMNRNQQLKALVYTQASGAATSNSGNATTFWLDKVRLTFSAQPVAASTITIAGTVYTFVASGATGTQVNIGASLFATLTNLGTVINAQNNSYHEVILSGPSASNIIDVFTYIGDATNVVLGGTTNAAIGALPTGTGVFAPLAKTYLSGGTNPINRAGLSVETHVQLCNEGNAAPWFIFAPHMTDDFVTQCVTYIRDNLAANQRPIFALGNEVWNTRFEFYEDCTFFAGLGIINNGGDPNSANVVGNAMLGYAWRFKQIMTIVKTLFNAVGQPDRFIRMGEGVVVGSVTGATGFLRRPGDGGSAAQCIADHVDHVADAPYYGSFGKEPMQRNQYVPGGTSYLVNQYCWNKAATSGFGTDGAYYIPAAFVSTTLANDIATGKLVSFTPTAAFDHMLRGVFSNVHNGKSTADYVQAQVNERGQFIKKSNYEAGQSNEIGSAVDPTFFQPFAQAFYRDAGFLRLESIYLHALSGDTGYAQQKGFTTQFNWPHLSANGSQWGAAVDNWGAQETPYSSAANSPRAQALYNARLGNFTAYWPPTTFPDPQNPGVSTITLTGNFPTVTGVIEVGGVLRLNLPTIGFAFTQTAQRTLDGVNSGAPVDVTGATFLDYTQVAGDVGKLVNWTVTRTSSPGMGPDAVYSTVNAVATTNPVVFESETTALLARMTVQPSTVQQSAINTFIAGMKSTSFLNAASQTIWSAMGRINIHWSHDRQAALLNWKGNTLAITDNGMPFTPYDAFVTNGNNALTLVYPSGVSVVPGYAQNDATNYAWLMVPAAAGAQHGYQNPGTNGNDQITTQAGNNSGLRVNGGGLNGGAVIDLTATGGWAGAVRDPASVGFTKYYQNATLHSTSAQASSAPSALNGILFQNVVTGAKSRGRIQGAHLTTAQIAEFVRLYNQFVANYLP